MGGVSTCLTKAYHIHFPPRATDPDNLPSSEGGKFALTGIKQEKDSLTFMDKLKHRAHSCIIHSIGLIQ